MSPLKGALGAGRGLGAVGGGARPGGLVPPSVGVTRTTSGAVRPPSSDATGGGTPAQPAQQASQAAPVGQRPGAAAGSSTVDKGPSTPAAASKRLNKNASRQLGTVPERARPEQREEGPVPCGPSSSGIPEEEGPSPLVQVVRAPSAGAAAGINQPGGPLYQHPHQPGTLPGIHQSALTANLNRPLLNLGPISVFGNASFSSFWNKTQISAQELAQIEAQSLSRFPEVVPTEIRETYEDCDRAHIINGGAYAVVVRARKKQGGGAVAVKVLEKQPYVDRDMLNQAYEEMANLRKASSFVRKDGREPSGKEHVVQLLQAFDQTDHLFFVTEFCDNQTLPVLQSWFPNRKLPLPVVGYVFGQMLQGVAFIHDLVRCGVV